VAQKNSGFKVPRTLLVVMAANAALAGGLGWHACNVRESCPPPPPLPHRADDAKPDRVILPSDPDWPGAQSKPQPAPPPAVDPAPPPPPPVPPPHHPCEACGRG
jgi:hypothetical protein